jgi:chemotaxis protein methyltransferase CheR
LAGFHELSAEHAEELKKLIVRWCGIVIDDKGAMMLEFRMHPLLDKYGCDGFEPFLQRARVGDAQIRDDVIDAVTTNETLWFRDSHLFENLLEEIMPALITRARTSHRKGLRIWSAASSTGQEAYSLSMLLHELVSRNQMTQGELSASSIFGTDISPAAIEIAGKGSYDPISMGRGMWPGYQDRFFVSSGRSAQVKPEVSRNVSFERRNLMDPMTGLRSFDLVMLRNVLIYFSPAAKSDILGRIRRVTNEDGVLVVGACEDASRYSREFATCQAGRTMYFQARRAS